MSIYDSLNPEQKRAVLHDKGPLLILAGAGSGKTRVLTHRIAYLIAEKDVNPWNILAVTFTNKAAREMKERVEQIIGQGSENIWVSTFHSTCVRILRRYIDRIGYERNFSIYDTSDSNTLMREVCKYLEIDTKRISEKSILAAISKAKDELISPEEFEKGVNGDYMLKKQAEAYREYQKRLKANNALDFDDLIVKTVELFMIDKEALTFFQNRFRYIMVDEYQDTNTAQFRLIHLLASGLNEEGKKEYNLCVVGDDDQSIYKFRGANIQNILNFEKAFTNTKVIKLEQNYRSTKSILDVANGIIVNNIGRKDKSLRTDNDKGEPVSYTLFESDIDEADNITSEIKRTVESSDASYKDFAILFRTNAQSRIFEEQLILKRIPYDFVGVKFFDRKEIKDILAYLKTIDNGLDSIAVKRILNVPRRGIGLTTITKVDDYSTLNGISFYDALVRANQIPGLERTASKIAPFVSMIEALRSRIYQEDYDLSELIDEILDVTGYLRDLENEDTEEAKDRIKNIGELITMLVKYVENSEERPTLSGFLEEAILDPPEKEDPTDSTDKVLLMTLHSAKGLEFPYVYICGMEEGIFPSYMSIYADNPQEEIEEERRLCYVGITRAMNHLFLSAAKHRMLRGEIQYNKPSRFIHEIPRYLMKINMPEKEFISNFTSKNSSPFSQYHQSQKNYKPYVTPEPKQFAGSNMPTLDYGIGDTVKHIKFGTGKVTDITMGGKDYEVSVDFIGYGTKKLLASFAKLSRVD